MKQVYIIVFPMQGINFYLQVERMFDGSDPGGFNCVIKQTCLINYAPG